LQKIPKRKLLHAIGGLYSMTSQGLRVERIRREGETG